MCIIASDGHIVAIPGPYLGKNNDASMTKHLATVPLKQQAPPGQQQPQANQPQPNQPQPNQPRGQRQRADQGQQQQGQHQPQGQGAPLGGFETE